MRQVIEISRASIQMTLMAISKDVLPATARTFVLAIVEQRLESVLKRYPDKTFRLTVETLDHPTVDNCTCLEIMAKNPKRHFRGCEQRDESYEPSKR